MYSFTDRLSSYREVLRRKSATPEERSYALYRMIMCFRGSPHDCTVEDIPLAERRSWYQRLKREYPHSVWAKNLKYYY